MPECSAQGRVEGTVHTRNPCVASFPLAFATLLQEIGGVVSPPHWGLCPSLGATSRRPLWCQPVATGHCKPAVSMRPNQGSAWQGLGAEGKEQTVTPQGWWWTRTSHHEWNSQSNGVIVPWIRMTPVMMGALLCLARRGGTSFGSVGHPRTHSHLVWSGSAAAQHALPATALASRQATSKQAQGGSDSSL